MTSPFVYDEEPGAPQAPTESASPFVYDEDASGGEGIISRAFAGAKGAVRGIGEVAKGIPRFIAEDVPEALASLVRSGGLTKEQLANPIIRARLISLGQDPDRIQAVSEEEALTGPSDFVRTGALPLVKSFLFAPYEEAKATLAAQTPEERGKHAALATFAAGALVQPFTVRRGAKPPLQPPTAGTTVGAKPPIPTPTPEGLSLGQMAQETIEKISTKKKLVSETTRIGRLAYNAWRKATTEQRAAKFPAAAVVADKPWKELTKEHKRTVRAVVEAEEAIKALDEANAKATAATPPIAKPPEPYQPKVDLPAEKSSFTPLETELDRVHGNIITLEAQARQLGPLIDNSRHRQFLERYAADLENEIRAERAAGEANRPQPSPETKPPDTNLGQVDITPSRFETVDVFRYVKEHGLEDVVRQAFEQEKRLNPDQSIELNSEMAARGVVTDHRIAIQEGKTNVEARQAAIDGVAKYASEAGPPKPSTIDITGLGQKVAKVINQPRNPKAQAALEARRAARTETPPTTEPTLRAAPEPTPSPGPAPTIPTTEPAPTPRAAGAPPREPSALRLVDSEGPLFGKSLEQLDALIDKVDEASHGQDVKLINEDLMRIAAAKKVLNARNTVGVQAPTGQVYPEFDMPVPMLRELQQNAKRMGGSEGMGMREAANRGLRFNKTFDELGEKLYLHHSELKSMVKQTSGVEQQRIQRRLADVEAELSRRAGGDLTQHVNVVENSILRNEKGFIKLLPDPLEAHPDLSNYSESGKRILAQINVEGTKTKLPSHRQFVNAARFHLERKILPIEEAVRIMSGGRYLPKFLDAGAHAQMYSGWPVRAEFMLTDAPFRWTPEGNIIISPVRGYSLILRDVRGRIPELRIFEAAARTIDAANRGKATGISLADAIKEFENARPEIVAAAQESVAFRNEILKYWADGGGVSSKALQLMIDAWPHYAPFMRILEGKVLGGLGKTITSKGTKPPDRLAIQQAVRKMIGSEALIQDPVQATVDMTRRLIRSSDRNMVFRRLIELAEQNPELAKGLVEKVTKKRLPRKQLEALQDEMIEATKTLFEEKGIAHTDESVAELIYHMTERKLGKGSDQIRFWREGKPETWWVHPDIARALEALDPQKVHFLVQMLSIPTRTARGGIVYNPIFAPLAAFKDAFEATLRSRYGFAPWNSLQGFADALSGTGLAKILGQTPTEYQRAFKATGGAFASLSGIRGQTTAAAVRAVLPGKAPVLTTLMHPVELLKKMSEPWEEAARIGEFRNALNQGATAFEAGLASKTITVDFNMSGASMQGLNMITAFLNPAIQSFASDIGALKAGERPAIRLASGKLNRLTPIELKELKPGTQIFGAKEPWHKRPGRVLAIGSGIALGTALLWAANRDDEEINQLRKTPYGKLWWWFRGPDGGIYKMPKPYFWGQVFASGAEAALDKMEADDPNAARDWIKAVKEQVQFTLLPNAVQYGLAVGRNRDPLTGASIVPERMEDIEPRFQIRPNTSLLARKAGEWFSFIDASPAQIDYFIRANLGTLGNDLNKAVTIAMNNDARVPDPLASELPFINRIIGSYPSLNVEPLVQFREIAADMEVINNTVLYLAREEPEKLEPYVESHWIDVGLSGIYTDARQSMNEIYAAMAAVDRTPAEQMSKVDRRARKEAYVKALIKLATVVNQRAEVARSTYKGVPPRLLGPTQ